MLYILVARISLNKTETSSLGGQTPPFSSNYFAYKEIGENFMKLLRLEKTDNIKSSCYRGMI